MISIREIMTMISRIESSNFGSVYHRYTTPKIRTANRKQNSKRFFFVRFFIFVCPKTILLSVILLP